MRYFMASVWFLLGPFVVVCLAAADPPAGKSAPPKYKATVHGADGHDKEESFDLSKAEHVERLAGHINRGEVHSLHKDEPVNVIALSWDLGLWTLVVFILLFLILRKLAWGPMLEGLHKREDAIRSAVEEAKLARAETEQLRAKFQKEMAEEFAKIPAIMDEARRDAAHMAEEMRAKAAADIQADRQRLRREIEMAKDQALQDIYHQGVQMATMMSAKVLGRHISEDDHRRLVDETLSELRSAGRG
jgi:F-type H+-transporting ATPase subunit b